MKPLLNQGSDGIKAVAPLAGAWIETNERAVVKQTDGVAPLAGAWIETAATGLQPPTNLRRPPRGGVD